MVASLFAGEFGIVYRARLSAHGSRNKEVAVKTLKGPFYEISRVWYLIINIMLYR